MDSVVEYLLDGLERVLELERELGVRTVEADKALLSSLVGSEGKTAPVPPAPQVARPPQPERRPTPPPLPPRRPVVSPPPVTTPVKSSSDLVFLHDRPLPPAGVEMMAKIIAALGRTSENAPIVVVPPAPMAKISVVLGARAMRLYFPELRGEPGQWFKLSDGRTVLITYSPDYILRFGADSPGVKKLKQDMWRSLKAVNQRLMS